MEVENIIKDSRFSNDTGCEFLNKLIVYKGIAGQVRNDGVVGLLWR